MDKSYVPFETQQEIVRSTMQHDVLLKEKTTGALYFIQGITKNSVYIMGLYYSYVEAFDTFTFYAGDVPFGKARGN